MEKKKFNLKWKKNSVFKSLISSMITHILLSLPNLSQIFIEEYEEMAKDFLGGGKPPKFRREILEYPYDLGGLQLHNLKRFSSSLKSTWLRRVIKTNSGWTTFAMAYEIDKCWLYGNIFLETKANNIDNRFWKDVVLSISDLRRGNIPVADLDYLSWPLWQDQAINLPNIKKLQKKM